jgi:ferrous iron transport protein B
MLTQQWHPATAWALLAWFVFAPQCLSTLATVKRETNSWRYPLIMSAYLFGLAYASAWVAFRVASAVMG